MFVNRANSHAQVAQDMRLDERSLHLRRLVMGRNLPGIVRLGIPDTFSKNYGIQDDLLEIDRLSPEKIASSVQDAARETDVA